MLTHASSLFVSAWQAEQPGQSLFEATRALETYIAEGSAGPTHEPGLPIAGS